ncbi:class I SAM-dependent methyltransferase [Rhodovulum sp. YNF3179]|uniref:class I SAM-dependent methyltransferase n=1 Tax=Rhodovulum sp. YNF3179 TaxID=3425127 RepID=UPI003D33318C
MTPLEETLRRQIAQTGPVSVADYMALCLLHPRHGYYMQADPLGAQGDFTTAPEISQMFGEMLGLCLAQAWLDQGSPAPFTLAELGPGRGTLMADALRATRPVPGFHAAMRLALVEASPALQARQAEALAGYAVTWCDAAADLPEGPLFVIANEFFDALPVRQFIRDPAGWRERRVGLRDAALAFGAADPQDVPELTARRDDTRDGELVELRPGAAPVVTEIAARIAGAGAGAALILDYGDWESRGDTLQAVRGHRPVDPLDGPGTADLTAHVDFAPLARAAEAAGAAVTPLTPQGVLLEQLGITPRAQALARNLSGAARESHVAAHRRLTHPEEMGSLFKAIGIYPNQAMPPPGFDP